MVAPSSIRVTTLLLLFGSVEVTAGCTSHQQCGSSEFCNAENDCSPCFDNDEAVCDPDAPSKFAFDRPIDGSCGACSSSPSPPPNPSSDEADRGTETNIDPGVDAWATAAHGVESVDLTLGNPRFESGLDHWATKGGAPVASVNFNAAAPNGPGFAELPAGTAVGQSINSAVVEAGKTYAFSAWVRGTNPRGVAGEPVAELALIAGGAEVATATINVGPSRLTGNSMIKNNDDGANIFFDGEYRMHVAGHTMYQPLAADPIQDPWEVGAAEYDGMASGVIITPQGLRAMYQTFYITDDDSKPTTSRIDLIPLVGDPPNYQVPDPSGEDVAGDVYTTILSHVGDEDPWCIDAHLFYDDDTGRLWMTWGGHHLWLSELDPATGMLIGNPASTEFTTHPAGAHRRIMSFKRWAGAGAHPADAAPPAGWEGDVLSRESDYIEGPSLFKHDGAYFFCGSVGSMDDSYTIRCCRSSTVEGPYTDKQGVDCASYDADYGRYGNSMLLGDEAGQLVPGHPHMWNDPGHSGQAFLGYDYRPPNSVLNGKDSGDTMGIRRMHWVNGWPTIWSPVMVSFAADDHPAAVGQPLEVAVRSVGASASSIGLDSARVSVSSADGGGGDGGQCGCATQRRGRRPA